jgi:integrase
VSKLDGPGAEAVARFQAHLRAAGRSASTVRTYGTLAGEFVAFAGTRGGLACCDAATIGAFVATLTGYQFKTVEQKLCAVRSFLRFASADGLVDGGCLEAVPAARSARQARIPSVRGPGEVARIVEAIDRDNPCGKRDYAIIMLIARLGLRGVDIRRLEFADFDWAGNRLAVTQAKTGDRVQLPLLKEVGWAVIDYIRHGRPACDCPQVFVRHLAPIGPFSDQDHLHQILVKHARVSEKRRHGMHSLRHSLATRLMEGGTPVEQIADILGHQSVRSTGVYLKSSLGLLERCALDPDAPAPEVSR